MFEGSIKLTGTHQLESMNPSVGVDASNFVQFTLTVTSKIGCYSLISLRNFAHLLKNKKTRLKENRPIFLEGKPLN